MCVTLTKDILDAEQHRQPKQTWAETAKPWIRGNKTRHCELQHSTAKRTSGQHSTAWQKATHHSITRCSLAQHILKHSAQQGTAHHRTSQLTRHSTAQLSTAMLQTVAECKQCLPGEHKREEGGNDSAQEDIQQPGIEELH